MITSKQKITLSVPEFGERYPLPEGATRWEQQEADRLFRNAEHGYREAIERLASSHENIVEGHPLTHPAGNDMQKASNAIAADHALWMFSQGVHHRLALEAKLLDPEKDL